MTASLYEDIDESFESSNPVQLDRDAYEANPENEEADDIEGRMLFPEDLMDDNPCDMDD